MITTCRKFSATKLKELNNPNATQHDPGFILRAFKKVKFENQKKLIFVWWKK